MEVVQLVKDYTFKYMHSAIELYLNANAEWCYQDLINHLKIPFESGETSSSLLSKFCSHYRKNKEMEDQCTKELQILGQKVISVRPD